jgi:hypothetical protein
MKIFDKVNQEITIGSIVAYGHALGRCAGIRIGKVLDIKTQEGRWVKEETEYRITVIGVDDDWNHKTPELCSRVGTLQFPNRMIVLDDTKVPASYKTLLDSYEYKKR